MIEEIKSVWHLIQNSLEALIAGGMGAGLIKGYNLIQAEKRKRKIGSLRHHDFFYRYQRAMTAIEAFEGRTDFYTQFIRVYYCHFLPDYVHFANKIIEFQKHDKFQFTEECLAELDNIQIGCPELPEGVEISDEEFLKKVNKISRLSLITTHETIKDYLVAHKSLRNKIKVNFILNRLRFLMTKTENQLIPTVNNWNGSFQGISLTIDQKTYTNG